MTMLCQLNVRLSQRAKVLDGENLRDSIIGMIKENISDAVNTYAADDEVHDDWNLDGIRDHFMGTLTTKDDLRFTTNELADITKEEIIETLTEKALALYEKRENEFGPELMREVERVVLLKTVDSKWMDHIDAMSELKQGIHLRSYGQKDPVVEYRFEGFQMFDEMVRSIREDTCRLVLTVQVKREEGIKREQVAKPSQENLGGDGTVKQAPVKNKAKVGRNDPCPCGSGKKYKKCCGINE